MLCDKSEMRRSDREPTSTSSFSLISLQEPVGGGKRTSWKEIWRSGCQLGPRKEGRKTRWQDTRENCFTGIHISASVTRGITHLFSNATVTEPSWTSFTKACRGEEGQKKFNKLSHSLTIALLKLAWSYSEVKILRPKPEARPCFWDLTAQQLEGFWPRPPVRLCTDSCLCVSCRKGRTSRTSDALNKIEKRWGAWSAGGGRDHQADRL